MKIDSLNELYDQFQNRIITKSKFESLIYNYYINNQRKTNCCLWQKEEYEDFLSWLFPRFKKLIDKYTDKGSTFEIYFSKFFTIASKEYMANKINVSIDEYSAWIARIPDLYVHEDEEEYSSERNEEMIAELINKTDSKKNPRRILALILKCYCYVSDDFIEKAAPIIGIKKEKLKGMIEKIKVLRQEKDDKIYKMKERLYCLYYKSIACEKKLTLIKENTKEYLIHKRKLELTRKQHKKLQERLNKTRTEATNSQIAEVIGVSKGCVDSSLFKLKAKFDLN